MNIKEEIARLGRKGVAWNIISLAVGTLLGIYGTFFYEKKPSVDFEVVSSASVFDIHENIGRLQISLDGKSLDGKIQALTVLVVKVVNDGQADVLPIHYDQADPLGFIIKNGSLIEDPVIISASNSYLTKQLKVHTDTREKVHFSPAIVEAKEYFVLKLLVLHNRDATLTLEPFGKIAGARVRVTEVYKEENSPGILSRAFSGDIATQALRSVGYFFGFFLLIAAISLPVGLVAWPFDAISRKREAKRRGDVIKRYKAELKDSNLATEVVNYVLDQYKKHGKPRLEEIERLLSDKNTLTSLLTINAQGSEFRQRIQHELASPLAQELLSKGLVVKGRTGYSVNERSRQALIEFLRHAW